MNYKIIYEHGPNEQGRGTWSAYVPGLPGVVSAGDTFEECAANIRETIRRGLAEIPDAKSDGAGQLRRWDMGRAQSQDASSDGAPPRAIAG